MIADLLNGCDDHSLLRRGYHARFKFVLNVAIRGRYFVDEPIVRLLLASHFAFHRRGDWKCELFEGRNCECFGAGLGQARLLALSRTKTYCGHM